jgi:hypothetical protein
MMMVLKTDGCIEVLAVWVVVSIEGLSWRELFVMVLWK